MSQMHVTSGPSSTSKNGSEASTSKSSSLVASRVGSFKIKLPKVDVQDCSMKDEQELQADFEEELVATMTLNKHVPSVPLIKSPTILTPPQCTPRSASPAALKSPSKTASTNHQANVILIL